MTSVLLRTLQGVRRATHLTQSKLYQCDALRSRSMRCLTSMVLSKHIESTSSEGMRKHIVSLSCLSRQTRQMNCVPGLLPSTSAILQTRQMNCLPGLVPSTSAILQTRQINCVPGLILQTVNASSFHTSSSLNGFFSRHRQGFREVPRPALVLGVSGLIPFVVPAVYTAATSTIGLGILWAQVAYGASILSFLGGVRWGFALTEGQGPTWSSLGYSVVPSLIAWLGLLMPLQSSQLCVMTGLLMAWAVDANTKVYPAWFKSLRLLLSLCALTSLGVTFGYSLVFEPISEEHGSNFIKLIKIVKIILEE